MSNRRYKGYNEIKVKLLPEKAKRDYILRLVSYIIVMIFVIINFFVVFLPRRELLIQVNNVKRIVYRLKAEKDNYYEVFSLIDKNIYNLTRNNEVDKIESKNIDFVDVINDFEENKPFYSFIENVNYNEPRSEFIITVQFNTLYDLTNYQNQLSSLDYVKDVKNGPIFQVPVTDGLNRFKTNFIISLDVEKAPKADTIKQVGDNND